MRKLLVTQASSAQRALLALVRPHYAAYAANHGYEFFARLDADSHGRAPQWAKIALLRELLDECDLCLWLDCDLVVRSSEDLLTDFHAEDFQALCLEQTPHGFGPNTGVWGLRGNDEARRFLDEVWQLGPVAGATLHDQARVAERLGWSCLPQQTKPVKASDWQLGTGWLDPRWNMLAVYHPEAPLVAKAIHYGGLRLEEKLAAMSLQLVRDRLPGWQALVTPAVAATLEFPSTRTLVMAELTELSVVIPVWGSYVNYLPELLAQLAAEGVRRERILIVANGESLRVEGYTVIETPALVSIGAARNLGLAFVNSELVCFCDADDLPYPGALAHLYTAARADRKAVVISGLATRADGALYPFPPAYATKPMGRLRRLVRQWGCNHLSMTTGTLICTAALRKAGGFPDYNLAEDGMLGCLMVWLGRTIVLPEPTRIYRQQANGLCQRGRSAAEWSDSFRFQRSYLAAHPALPWPLRQLTRLYAPKHERLSLWLEQVVRFDR